MKTDIDVIDNIIQAISILNKTDEYLEGLTCKLSECDQMKSDFEHIVENNKCENINLQLFFNEFQKCLLNRRKVKKDLALNNYYKNNISKLREKSNREFLIQGLKSIDNEKSDSNDYQNRILTDDILESFKNQEKPKRGRPKKEILTK